MVVPHTALTVTFDKAVLESEADVDAYVEAMRNALLGAIQSGKRVTV